MKKEHSIDTEIPMDELLSLKPGWQRPSTFETLMQESNIREVRNTINTRLLSAIQASDRPVQLEEQRKWIEALWQKIGADNVFEPYTKEEAAVVKDISTILFSYIDRRMPEFTPSGAKAQFATKITHMKAQKLLDNIYLTALKLGLFEESGDVHIHDICAQDGMTGIVIAASRDCIPENGVTSTLESETNQLEGQNFLFINSFFGTKLSRFAYGDSDGLEFKNHPERKTYWIANGPPIFKTLMGDIAKMDQADLPEGIALITCYCHCFQPDDEPSEQGTLEPADHQRLIEIIIAGNLDPNPASRIVAMQAMKLIDCARAKFLNTRNSAIKAYVQEMPGTWTSGIFVKKA